jgi:hypothetical protein
MLPDLQGCCGDKRSDYKIQYPAYDIPGRSLVLSLFRHFPLQVAAQHVGTCVYVFVSAVHVYTWVAYVRVYICMFLCACVCVCVCVCVLGMEYKRDDGSVYSQVSHLGINDILNQVTVRCGSCLVGAHQHACPLPIRHREHYLPPRCDNQKCLQTLSKVPSADNHCSPYGHFTPLVANQNCHGDRDSHIVSSWGMTSFGSFPTFCIGAPPVSHPTCQTTKPK